jgi:hypothetical protein
MPVIPSDSERMFICGRTGSGKTTEALYQLAQRSIDTMVWVIISFKPDPLLRGVPVTAPLSLGDPVPELPGLYIAEGTIEDAAPGGPLDRFLREALERGNVGIVLDEVYVVGQRCVPLHLLLMQGRSSNNPLVMISQRPAWVDPWAKSESEYFVVFQQQLPDDVDNLNRFCPSFDFEALARAGRHHSYFYNARDRQIEMQAPCAASYDDICAHILARLPVYEDAPPPPAPSPLPRRVRV